MNATPRIALPSFRNALEMGLIIHYIPDGLSVFKGNGACVRKKTLRREERRCERAAEAARRVFGFTFQPLIFGCALASRFFLEEIAVKARFSIARRNQEK